MSITRSLDKINYRSRVLILSELLAPGVSGATYGVYGCFWLSITGSCHCVYMHVYIHPHILRSATDSNKIKPGVFSRYSGHCHLIFDIPLNGYIDVDGLAIFNTSCYSSSSHSSTFVRGGRYSYESRCRGAQRDQCSRGSDSCSFQ